MSKLEVNCCTFICYVNQLLLLGLQPQTFSMKATEPLNNPNTTCLY